MADPQDPITAIQNVLSSLDPEAVCTGFATLAEWIDADGSSRLTIVHSPMSPWHLAGMLSFAGQPEVQIIPIMMLPNQDLEDDDGL